MRSTTNAASSAARYSSPTCGIAIEKQVTGLRLTMPDK